MELLSTLIRDMPNGWKSRTTRTHSTHLRKKKGKDQRLSQERESPIRVKSIIKGKKSTNMNKEKILKDLSLSPGMEGKEIKVMKREEPLMKNGTMIDRILIRIIPDLSLMKLRKFLELISVLKAKLKIDLIINMIESRIGSMNLLKISHLR